MLTGMTILGQTKCSQFVIDTALLAKLVLGETRKYGFRWQIEKCVDD